MMSTVASSVTSSCFSWFRRAQVISDSTLEAEMMSFSGSTRCPPRGMISNQRRIPGTRTDLILVVGTRLASEAGQKAGSLAPMSTCAPRLLTLSTVPTRRAPGSKL